MQLDKTKYSVLIDKIINIFSTTFGKDIMFLEKEIAIEHMGYFKIQYRYLPLAYNIVFENDRDVFSVDIYDSEGAHNLLYRIEKYDNQTTVENVDNAIKILKNVLKKNNFCFYIMREGKLYRKEKQQYRRVKDMTEFVGGNVGGTKTL